ncbi:MAG: AbrB/MazE/SpoVT family DNA-binding domain-containing protein [Defluviitaleaceae bacterium]|nr:AbrB/MazE/SpoVT family DNA-binding domain-containing protein [Defluviitaleaceae bacterium]
MERYSSRVIDEQGRLVLHGTLRKKLGLETGDKISLSVVDTIVILQKVKNRPESESAVCEVDQLGMISLSKELRQTLNWKTKDEIALYHTDNLIILKSA